jgi:predicted PhzF superfamily epimerase YddE/YHI9
MRGTNVDLEVTVLRVFCGENGAGGNRLGVVVDGPAVAEDDRQALARFLGYSETVFVDDAETGRIRIFTPEQELPFAGHPVVGTGWLLAREGYPADALLTPAGRVAISQRDGRTTARARPEWCPPFELIEYGSAAEVDALSPGGRVWRYCWAWTDRPSGRIRARCFVSEAGIPEDEATGAAAVRLCAELGRPIEIDQGRGSVILAEPVQSAAMIELSGRVVPD